MKETRHLIKVRQMHRAEQVRGPCRSTGRAGGRFPEKVAGGLRRENIAFLSFRERLTL